jgi:hypothetical protein
MRKNKSLVNQKGMAAIMFAMFMAVVITLLAIGFAVIVRNDQRQTLDKTLSNQAQYAAESAINRKYRELVTGTETTKDNPIDCRADDVIKNNSGIILDAMPDVKLTCLTWTSKPDVLSFTGVGSAANPLAVAPIRPAGASAIDFIKITWKDPGGATGTSANIIRLTLTNPGLPTLRIAAAQKNNITDTRIVYANPAVSGGTSDFSGESGKLANGQCSANECWITLSSLPGGPWDNSVGGYLSVASINGSSDVFVQAFNNSNPTTPLLLQDAQISIDATAKSQDVIKRLKANVSIQVDTWRPSFAASANRLCKNYMLDGTMNIIKPVGSPYESCP